MEGGGEEVSGQKAPSVLVDPEEPDAVQLRKLRDEHGEQRHRVDDEVDPVVFGVEAGEEVATEEKSQGEKDIRYQEDQKHERDSRESRHSTTLCAVLNSVPLYSDIITEHNRNVGEDSNWRGKHLRLNNEIWLMRATLKQRS